MLVPLMKPVFMPALTDAPATMTTRKPAARRHPLIARLTPLFAALLLLAGCATPGPNRGYYLSSENTFYVMQFDPTDPAAPVTRQASYLRLLDVPFGMAYDPFTDHFFIRLNPGNRLHVVDRPDRSIKRVFKLNGFDMPAGAGDLAIRSRDRHLFLINPAAAELVEFDLNGGYERTVSLDRPAKGVAYDQAHNRLLTLHGPEVVVRGLDGGVLSTVTLARPVKAGGLAFDPAAREYFVPLAGADELGVFAEDGALLRTLPLPPESGWLSFDVGPRSLLRLF